MPLYSFRALSTMIGRVLLWHEPVHLETKDLPSEPSSLPTLPSLLIRIEDIPLEGIEEDWDFTGTLEASDDENEEKEER